MLFPFEVLGVGQGGAVSLSGQAPLLLVGYRERLILRKNGGRRALHLGALCGYGPLW